MTFSKHNWNQLSESSQNELKRLQEEAYNSGRESVLNEQFGAGDPTSGLGDWGQWDFYAIWGYNGRIRMKWNDDGTVSYEFDPAHPHYGPSYTGPYIPGGLGELLNPANFGDKPGDFVAPPKDDKLVAQMTSGLQGRGDTRMGGMPTSGMNAGMGMGMGMREAWKAGFDAGTESLREQMGMSMNTGMGDKAMSSMKPPSTSGTKPSMSSGEDLPLEPPKGTRGSGGWMYDEHGFYYRDTVWDFGPPLVITVRYYWDGSWHSTRPDGSSG